MLGLGPILVSAPGSQGSSGGGVAKAKARRFRCRLSRGRRGAEGAAVAMPIPKILRPLRAIFLWLSLGHAALAAGPKEELGPEKMALAGLRIAQSGYI